MWFVTTKKTIGAQRALNILHIQTWPFSLSLESIHTICIQDHIALTVITLETFLLFSVLVSSKVLSMGVNTLQKLSSASEHQDMYICFLGDTKLYQLLKGQITAVDVYRFIALSFVTDDMVYVDRKHCSLARISHLYFVAVLSWSIFGAKSIMKLRIRTTAILTLKLFNWVFVIFWE